MNKKSALQVIYEVHAHYLTNPRAIINCNENDVSCKYYDSNTGFKCAAGLYIENPERLENYSFSIAPDNVEKYKIKFKSEVSHLPLMFWRHLQAWHDNDRYWYNDNSLKELSYLTKQGQIYLQKMIQKALNGDYQEDAVFDGSVIQTYEIHEVV